MKLQTKMVLAVLLVLAVSVGAGGGALITMAFQSSLIYERQIDVRVYETVVESLRDISQTDDQTSVSDMHTVLYSLD